MADQDYQDGPSAPGQKHTPAAPNDRRGEGQYGQSNRKPVGQWLIDKVSQGLTVFGGGRAPTTPPPGAMPLPPTPVPTAQSRALVPLEGLQPPGAPPPPPPVGPPPDPGNNGWFDPGRPMLPMAPRQDVAGREFDFPSSYNVNNVPRAFERWSFETLQALADNYDLIKLLIETRKDQMTTLTGAFLPVQPPGQDTRPPADDRCTQLNEFFKKPDKRLSYNQWQRKLLDDLFIIDAPCLYIRRDLAGRPYALEIVKGSTITPRIDMTGRPAEPPLPAYTQYLKGQPAINYRTDELIYWPRNPRPGHLFGHSPVEQIIATVTLGLKREAAKLAYYNTGNIPDALVNVPADWKPSDIKQFQADFDARMTDPRRKFGKLTFVPAGTGGAVFTRTETGLFGEFDEWLARICCYAFSLPELPFVKAQNRATAETANENALSQGLAPLMVWWKSLKDHVAQEVFGYPDIEFVYDDKEDIDPAELIETHLPAMEKGLISGDELRGKMGLSPIGMAPIIYGVGPLGAMFVSDFIKASQMGLALPQPPAAPAGPPGAPGAPPPGIMPPAAEPPSAAPALEPQFSTIPQALLTAVGLGPDGPAARHMDVTSRDEFTSDPLHRAVGHPQVLKTLRQAEALHMKPKAAKPGRKPPGRSPAQPPRGKSSQPQLGA